MCVPAHAHCDPHSPVWPDSYENFMGSAAIYPQYTHNELPVFDASGNVTGTKTWGLTDEVWPYREFSYVRFDIPGTKWDPNEPNEQNARARWETQSDLFRLFWATAEIADNYDSNDANGEVDKGTRRSGGFTAYELRVIADSLMPQAMVSQAELYRLFFQSIEQGLPRIHLLQPANASAVSWPPTFTWTSTGLGAEAVYAVDGSLTPSFTSYWSTYDNMGLLISGQSWTMPFGVWGRVPAGRQMFWRVRGANLDVKPLSVISSDEVWSFTKQ